VRNGDRIAEGIVHIAHVGLRIDRQAGVQQTQVVAVARPEHQPVVAQDDGLGIFVTGPMDDLESAHAAR